MAVLKHASRYPLAVTGFVALATAVVGLGATSCGKPEVTKSAVAAIPEELAFSRISGTAPGVELLFLKGNKSLRALAKDGKVYGLNGSALSAIAAEAVDVLSLSKEPGEKGEGFSLGAESAWLLGSKQIIRYLPISGKGTVLSAASKGAHPVLFVSEEKLVANFDGKLEVYSVKDKKLMRAELDWPLRDEPPLAGGFNPTQKAYWFASEKSFVYLEEDGSGYTALPIQAKGVSGKILAWTFKVAHENFDERTVPNSAAALTSEGLFATKDLVEGAKVAAGKGGGGTPITPPGAAGGEKYAFADVKAVIDENCVACHAATIGSFGPAATEASWTAEAGKSKLIDRLSDAPKTGQAMPPAGMDAAKKKLLLAYLNGESKPAPVAPPVAAPPAAMQPPAMQPPMMQPPAMQPPMMQPPAMVANFEINPHSAAGIALMGLEKADSDGVGNIQGHVRHVSGSAVGSEGKLTFSFPGESGNYKVEVLAVDENDGENKLKLYKGTTKVGADVIMNKDTNNVETFVLGASVAFVKGEQVTIGIEKAVAKNGGDERGRTTLIKFSLP